MSENYSRRNHSSKEEKKSAPKVTKHVKKASLSSKKYSLLSGQSCQSLSLPSLLWISHHLKKRTLLIHHPISQLWSLKKATIRPKNQMSPHLAMAMQLTQKQRQAAKLVITPILHQQTQQLVEIQLLLHPQPLQTQQLAIRQLVTPQLVALFPTKTKKRLGTPCLFSIILWTIQKL